jgi:site-specific DNA recombinase
VLRLLAGDRVPRIAGSLCLAQGTVRWQRVQAIRAAHTSAGDRQQAHDHYLKGTVYCGSCDSRLLVTHSTNRHGVTYPYFICSGRHRKRTTCTRQAVLIDWVTQQIEREYATISLPSEIAEALVTRLTRDFAELHESSERERQRLQREHDRLRAEQASLLQAHYAGAVPLDLLKQEQPGSAAG